MQTDLSLTIPASPDGVRDAIAQISLLVEPLAKSEKDITVVELLLAEVLNNVFEHAYEAREGKECKIKVEIAEDDLCFLITDWGKPMPNGRLPLGLPADPSLPPSEQAEGGYGLFMIRQIARKLRYNRIGDRNCTSFVVSMGRPLNLDMANLQ